MWGSPASRVASFETACEDIRGLFKGSTIIGHSLWNDFAVLNYEGHPEEQIRDLALFQPFKDQLGRTLALRKLSARFLEKDIQQAAHSSVEDARASLALYRLFEAKFDAQILGKS